jgi:hypothetical protein
MCVAKRHNDWAGATIALLVHLLLVESPPPRYFGGRGGSQQGVVQGPGGRSISVVNMSVSLRPLITTSFPYIIR